MIYFNTWPLVSLSGSVTCAYFGAKTACSGLSKLLQLPFGSTPVSERVDQVVKETIEGSLSLRGLFFGTENKKERLYQFISGSILIVKSVSLLFFAYALSYASKKEFIVSEQKLNSCKGELNQFHSEVQKVNQHFAAWTKRLCEFDKAQWETFSREIEGCLSYSKLGYSQVKEDCEKSFAELTYRAQFEDLIPRLYIHKLVYQLKEKRSEILGVCKEVLFATETKVNQKCSYLYPYIGLNGRNLCRMIQYIPFIEGSKECTEECSIHEHNYDDIYEKIQAKLPQTENIEIDCPQILAQTKILPEEMLHFGEPLIPKAQVLKNIAHILSQGGDDLRNTSYSLERKGLRQSRFGHPMETKLSDLPQNHAILQIFRNVLSNVRAKLEFQNFLDQYKGIFENERFENRTKLSRRIIR